MLRRLPSSGRDDFGRVPLPDLIPQEVNAVFVSDGWVTLRWAMQESGKEDLRPSTPLVGDEEFGRTPSLARRMRRGVSRTLSVASTTLVGRQSGLIEVEDLRFTHCGVMVDGMSTQVRVPQSARGGEFQTLPRAT